MTGALWIRPVARNRPFGISASSIDSQNPRTRNTAIGLDASRAGEKNWLHEISKRGYAWSEIGSSLDC